MAKTREKIKEFMEYMDVDKSNLLDNGEFQAGIRFIK